MNASFVRKVIYLVLIAILLVPLYLISAPSFQDSEGRLSEGGLLTRVRRENGLSQANLGDIDPASESMKLATLGMRGIAANLLWERANEYKKKEQWDNLRATLNQIAKLQPNFISVWSFQAWNLSYNVSVEFDNYKHRYHWVKKGIEFLMEGTRYNRNEPRLLWDLGWFFGHKVGRSDEYRQFRREYGIDRDFHETLPIDVDAAKDFEGKPDNWLTAHQWFLKAQTVVDNEGVPIKGKNPLVFHSDIPKSLIRYGIAIEEGENAVFGEIAGNAWRKAYESWLEYGSRSIPTSYGYMIELNEGERWKQRAEERKQELSDFLPGLEDRLKQERLALLTDEERELIAQEKTALDAAQYDIVTRAEDKILVTPNDIVEASPPDKRREARRLANRYQEAEAYATTIRRYRTIVNFIYWRTRCEVEGADAAIKGREYLKDANDLVNDADLEGAREKYDQAWARWARIHDENPVLADDVTAEDLVEQLKKYRTMLNQMDEVFPPGNFPMVRLVANYRDEFGLSEEEADELLTTADALRALRSARDSLAEASVAIERSNWESAKSTFESSWPRWREALNLDADTVDEAATAELVEALKQYREALTELGESFPPADFVLTEFWEQHATPSEPEPQASSDEPATGDNAQGTDSDAVDTEELEAASSTPEGDEPVEEASPDATDDEATTPSA